MPIPHTGCNQRAALMVTRRQEVNRKNAATGKRAKILTPGIEASGN